MKCIVDEIKGEGFEKLLGEIVTVYCASYIYSGKLAGLNDTCLKLSDCYIVYDTGGHDTKTWGTAEKMPGDWYIQLSSIESFGIFKQVK